MGLYSIIDFISRAWNRVVITPIKRSALGGVGTNVHFGRKLRMFGAHNITLGNNVSLGEQNIIMTTKAKVNVGNHVMTAPRVTMITGGHRIDLLGRFMIDIGNDEKNPDDDKDIIIEGDNWIGAGAIILKGVTVCLYLLFIHSQRPERR